MRISYNWLKELLPDLDLSPEEVGEALTMHSFEIDSVTKWELDEKVTVVKIVKLEKHPNADKLRLATIDTGSEELTVVCGAPNIFEGAIVPYSPPGTVVQDADGQDFELRVAKIRGVESPGMLNSPRELGLGETHEGIYLLPEDTPLGSKLGEHLPADYILEADITPNRAHDAMSHLGVARELAALLNLEVVVPAVFDLAATPELEEWGIDIADNNDCACYMGVLLDGVAIKPSPLSLQAKLWAAGGKPINNVVDATNLVLFEQGQPTHAFDTASLNSKKIGVRKAQAGEKVMALDEVEYELTPEDLVVTDEDKPTAIAGVMGGLGSGIKEDTKQVFLEAANFRSFSVQETSRRLRLISESSKRFAKEITPALVEPAAARVVQLLVDHAGAKVTGQKWGPKKAQDLGFRNAISFRPERVRQLAGSEISDADCEDVLTRLRFAVEKKNDTWHVTPPAERLDIQGEHDVVEEVVRLLGLSQIIPRPVALQPKNQLPAFAQQREVLRDILVEHGFAETMNYSFAEGGAIKVANPVSPETASMREEVWPQVLSQLLDNRAELKAPATKEGGLFELGIVFAAESGGRVEGILETERLAVVAFGQDASARLTGLEEAIKQKFGVASLPLTKLAENQNKVTSKLGLPVFVWELDVTTLFASVEAEVSWQAGVSSEEVQQFVLLPKFPAVYRDISVLVAPDVSVEQVQEIIERIGGKLVVDVDLFDEFSPAGEDETSLAFHVTYQSPEKTLADQEVAEVHNKIVAALYEEIAAKLRE